MHYTGQGLDQTKDVNELNVCQSLCRARPGCDTIDMDSSTNPKCWMKTKNFQTTEREIKNQKGATNYMTDQRCLDLIEGVGKSRRVVSCFMEIMSYELRGLF